MKKIVVVLLSFIMLLSMTACGGSSSANGSSANGSSANGSSNSSSNGGSSDSPKSVKVFKMGHPDPAGDAYADYHYQLYMRLLNKHLQEICDGAIQFEEVGGGQMGSEAEMFSGLSDGSLQSACTSIGAYSSQVPVLEIFNLPYIFQYSGQYQVLTENDEFMESIFKTLEEDWNIVCLSKTPVHCGFREVLTHKPINSMEDFKNMVVRITSSPLNSLDWELLGAIPSSIPYGEVYTSMQQGVIDAICMPTEALAMNAYYEVSEYLTIIDMHDLQGWHMMSKATWDTLTEEEQGWLKEAADLAVADELAGVDAHIEQLIDEFQTEHGITVCTPDLTEFKTATRSAHEQYRNIIGSDILDEAYRLLDIDNAEKGLPLLNP